METDQTLFNKVYAHNHPQKEHAEISAGKKSNGRASFIPESPTPANVGPSTYNVLNTQHTANIVFKKYRNKRFLDSEVEARSQQLPPGHYEVRPISSTNLPRQLNRSDRASPAYYRNFGEGQGAESGFYNIGRPFSPPERVPISFNRADRFPQSKRRSLSVFIGPGSYDLNKRWP